jgi:hypothetical protein
LSPSRWWVGGRRGLRQRGALPKRGLPPARLLEHRRRRGHDGHRGRHERRVPEARLTGQLAGGHRQHLHEQVQLVVEHAKATAGVAAALPMRAPRLRRVVAPSLRLSSSSAVSTSASCSTAFSSSAVSSRTVESSGSAGASLAHVRRAAREPALAERRHAECGHAERGQSGVYARDGAQDIARARARARKRVCVRRARRDETAVAVRERRVGRVESEVGHRRSGPRNTPQLGGRVEVFEGQLATRQAQRAVEVAQTKRCAMDRPSHGKFLPNSKSRKRWET